jgi:hypothetical protein
MPHPQSFEKRLNTTLAREAEMPSVIFRVPKHASLDRCAA